MDSAKTSDRNISQLSIKDGWRESPLAFSNQVETVKYVIDNNNNNNKQIDFKTTFRHAGDV